MNSTGRDGATSSTSRITRSTTPAVAAASSDPTKQRASPRLANHGPHALPTSPGVADIFTSAAPRPPETPTKSNPTRSIPLPSPSRPRPAEVTLSPPNKFGYSEVMTTLPEWEEPTLSELHILQSTKLHEKRANANDWSWLHQFELARYLHAGLPQKALVIDQLPGKVLPRSPEPVLQPLYNYLQTLAPRVPRAKESLFQEIPECESLPEMEAAFKQGTIQFTATLVFDKDAAKPTLTLNPPSVEGQGNRFTRRYGSDRFLRIRLDDTVTKIASSAPTTVKPDPAVLKRRDELRKIFGEFPLVLFGRRYRQFCDKDNAMVFWAESGPGLETIPLVQFAENHISAALNPGMSVAKYRSRFELGLSTSTPTTQFSRNQVLRVPDIMSDSLKISYNLLRGICDDIRATDHELAPECLPDGYVPTAIHGSYKQLGGQNVPFVWRLDFSTVPAGKDMKVDAASDFIELYGSATDYPVKPRIVFEINAKDGRSLQCSISVADKAAVDVRAKLQAAGRDCVWALAPSNLWRDLRFIEVRDSQFKYNDAQSTIFDFEVLNIPHGKDSANLGKQTFEVLGHAGVPSTVFSDLLKAHLDQSADAFLDWSNLPALLREIEAKSSVFEDRVRKAKIYSDPASLRPYSQDASATDDSALEFVLDGRLDPCSGAPNTIAEVLVEMLQSGFDPNTSPALASKIKKVLLDYTASQIQFKIQSKQCRTVLVIADHFGILEEGEVFFQASEPIVDANGYGQRNVVMGDILVSRPPCLQPCDIQKFNAVFKPEYSSLFDVIVMSCKGEQPACSILSGGDYDGDKLLLILIESVVESFDSARADPKFATPPFPDEKWFSVDRRKVKDLIQPLIEKGDSGKLAEELSATFFQFSSFAIMAGAHNSLSYTLGLSKPKTSEAAHILAKSLDGRKQGFSHTPDQWMRIKAEFMLDSKEPAYVYRERMSNYDQVLPADRKFAVRPVTLLGRHPLDAMTSTGKQRIREIEEMTTNKTKSNVLAIDDDLAFAWRDAYAYAVANDKVNAKYWDYRAMRAEWGQQRHQTSVQSNAHAVAGSPSKSPTKKRSWKGSSPDKKQQLLDLTEAFWEPIAEDSNFFISSKLLGPGGPELARSLLASCAYLLPISPREFTLLPTPTPFLEKLQATRSATHSTNGTTPSPLLSPTRGKAPVPTSEKMDVDLDDDPFNSTQFSMSYSQFANAEAGVLSPSTVRTTSRSPSTSSMSPLKLPTISVVGFNDAMAHPAYLFCLDMAHRDVVGLKADANTRRLHPASARGLQAPKLTPHMHTVMGVKNKAAAGIVDAKKATRPKTLLPHPEEPIRPSPTKKAKTY
ncbi:hypothetical protein RQP46_001797 [Phenoliferia psychrophenolica]